MGAKDEKDEQEYPQPFEATATNFTYIPPFDPAKQYLNHLGMPGWGAAPMMQSMPQMMGMGPQWQPQPMPYNYYPQAVAHPHVPQPHVQEKPKPLMADTAPQYAPAPHYQQAPSYNYTYPMYPYAQQHTAQPLATYTPMAHEANPNYHPWYGHTDAQIMEDNMQLGQRKYDFKPTAKPSDMFYVWHHETEKYFMMSFAAIGEMEGKWQYDEGRKLFSYVPDKDSE